MKFSDWLTFSDWLGIIGVMLAVLGFVYGWWENRKRARLSDFVRAQNWSLFNKASVANGHAQLALAKYKTLGKESVDLEVLELLSKADAFGQDLFKDSVRQIQFSEPVFDDTTVSRWVREGRVQEGHAILFRQLTRADKPIHRCRRPHIDSAVTRSSFSPRVADVLTPFKLGSEKPDDNCPKNSENNETEGERRAV